jgi:hypothetical protein
MRVLVGEDREKMLTFSTVAPRTARRVAIAA